MTTAPTFIGILSAAVLSMGLAAQDTQPGADRVHTPVPIRSLPTHITPKPFSGPAPRIHCPQPLFDFGQAAQNDKVEHEFEIVNTGEGQLEIMHVQPSCSCAAAMPDKKSLAPKEKTVIKATMNTLTFQGPISKTITVTSNDPVTPSLTLTMSGKIQQPFHPTVTELNFGSLKKGTEIPSKTFDVLTGTATGTITDIRTDNPQVRASYDLMPAGQSLRGYRVKIDIEGMLPVGQLRSMVTITTDVPAQRSISLPVVALVEGEITVNPRTFNFGKVKRGETVSKIVDITKSGAKDLKIEDVKLKPEGPFSAKVEEVKPGEHYRLVMGVSPDAPAGYQRGTVTVQTNCPGETSLQIYFYVLVQQ